MEHFPFDFVVDFNMFLVCILVLISENRFFFVFFVEVSVVYLSSLHVILLVIIIISTSPGSVDEGFSDEILHDDFVPLDLFLSFDFDCFEFVFRLGVLESSIDFIHQLFYFFNLMLKI